METYTIILDYKGGTYIAQFGARDFKDAQQKWLTKLETEGIQDVDSKVIDELRRGVEENGFVLLEGGRNIYYGQLRVFRKYARVHFIKTDIS